MTQSNDELPRCKSCGVPFEEHDGLQTLCRKYFELAVIAVKFCRQEKKAELSKFIRDAGKEPTK